MRKLFTMTGRHDVWSAWVLEARFFFCAYFFDKLALVRIHFFVQEMNQAAFLYTVVRILGIWGMFGSVNVYIMHYPGLSTLNYFIMKHCIILGDKLTRILVHVRGQSATKPCSITLVTEKLVVTTL